MGVSSALRLSPISSQGRSQAVERIPDVRRCVAFPVLGLRGFELQEQHAGRQGAPIAAKAQGWTIEEPKKAILPGEGSPGFIVCSVVGFVVTNMLAFLGSR